MSKIKKRRKPAKYLTPRDDRSKVLNNKYYIVDLRNIRRPQVIRNEVFNNPHDAKVWLRRRRLVINVIQFQIEKGKVIKEYNIPWLPYYVNAGDKVRKKISLLYSGVNDNRGYNGRN